MTSTADHYRRKAWKWLFLLHRAHPSLRVHFRVVDGNQHVLLTAGSWRLEFVISNQGIAVAHDDGASVPVVSFGDGVLDSAKVLAVLGEQLGGEPFHQLGAASTHELYAQRLKALCLYARATGCSVATTRFGAWLAGPMTFAPSGALEAGGRTVDLSTSAFVTLSDDEKVGALAKLAAGGAVTVAPELAAATLEGGSLHARFAPESDDDVLLVREACVLQRWRVEPAKAPSAPVTLGLKPGFASFWKGPKDTWLITSEGQAQHWAGDGNQRIVETGLIPTKTHPGPRPIMAGDKLVFAAAVDGQRIRLLRVTGPLDQQVLLESLSGMNAGAPHGKPLSGTTLAYEGGRWLVAANPGTRLSIYGLVEKGVHETEDGNVDGHPERCAIHPFDTLVAQLSRNVCFFEPASGRLLFTLELGPGPKPDGVFHPRKPYFLILRGGELLAFRLDTQQLRLLVTLSTVRWPTYEHSALAISATGSRVVAGRDKTWLFTWERLEELFERGQDITQLHAS